MSDKCFLCSEKYIKSLGIEDCVYCNYRIIYWGNNNYFKICYGRYELLFNGWLFKDSVFVRQFELIIPTPEDSFRALDSIIKNEIFV